MCCNFANKPISGTIMNVDHCLQCPRVCAKSFLTQAKAASTFASSKSQLQRREQPHVRSMVRDVSVVPTRTHKQHICHFSALEPHCISLQLHYIACSTTDIRDGPCLCLAAIPVPCSEGQCVSNQPY